MGTVQQNFGNYQLIDRLAVGGMAEVFLATVHGEAGFVKPVVIKRLHERFNEDDEFVDMFIEEARLTAQLMHGNICQVLDLGSVDGAFFMAMEFIAGEDICTLQEHASRQGVQIPLGAAVFMISEALAGLDYAHRKEDTGGSLMGVVHRDVSPQNILISYEGGVKVIDFGIAKVKNRARQTEAGVIKGKFRYMSPEQASGLPMDHRTDIFAAGVVLYELLCGEPHSRDLPETEVLHRMRKAIFAPIRRQGRGVPKDLERMVFKALKRKPAQRYPTAAEFRNDLLDLLSSRRLRFGNSELAALMHQVFDDKRRRLRSASPSAMGEMLQASSVGGTARRRGSVSRGRGSQGRGSQGRGSQGRGQGRQSWSGTLGETPQTEPFMELSQEDLVLEPTGAGPLEEVPTPPLEDPTRAYVNTGSGQPAAGTESRRSARAGAFSLQAEDRSRVRKVTSARWKGGGPEPAPQPVPRAATPPPAKEPTAASSGGKTALGTVVVLLFGAATLGALYHFQPAFLGLGELGGPAAEGAPAGQAPDQALPSPGPKKRRGRATGSPKGTIRIRSTPPGAAVTLCGVATGKVTPTRLRVPAGAGPCTILLTLAGHEAYELPAVTREDDPITIMTTLRKLTSSFAPGKPRRRAPPTRVTRGQLRVTSIQAGTVVVNGEVVGQTPRLDLSLRPGGYRVRVRFSGQESQMRRVTVRAGKLSKLHFDGQ